MASVRMRTAVADNALLNDFADYFLVRFLLLGIQ